MTILDPHRPALGKVRLGIPGLEIGNLETLIDLLKGKVWAEGSYGAGDGDKEQVNFHSVFSATRQFIPSFRDFIFTSARPIIRAVVMNRLQVHFQILLSLKALSTTNTTKFHGIL